MALVQSHLRGRYAKSTTRERHAVLRGTQSHLAGARDARGGGRDREAGRPGGEHLLGNRAIRKDGVNNDSVQFAELASDPRVIAVGIADQVGASVGREAALEGQNALVKPLAGGRVATGARG